MRVLLVEDDTPLSEALADSLRKSGYVVDCVFSGQNALSALSGGDMDMVILDLGLPDMDGLQVLKTMRSRKNTVPVIILTARDSVDDKIVGLDTGADDYLPKPFEVSELLARLRVMERRLGTANSALIEINEVSLDTHNLVLTIDNRPITLPRRELMLLKSLMENAGRIRSKQQLESSLYDWGDEVASNTVEVHIHHLRKKLPEGFIKTIRGVGYSISKKKAS